ncbi:MAG: ATP-binding cassette domain-containing protein, partial [Anaerolineae bacterium]
AIFITHKMGEVLAFSDRVQVLRRGEQIAVKDTADTTQQELARLMVGREVLFRLDKKVCTPGDVVLELQNVRALDDKGLPALRGISLKIQEGEILGIAGVAGNGQRQLAEVITGLRELAGGEIMIRGEAATQRTPLEIIRAGVSHIPADRVGMGAVGDMAVADNLAMKGYRKPPLAESGILRPNRIVEFARSLISTFDIMTPSPQTRIKFLSGGNIQKAILAREIDACGGLMVAVYPSRGLDVGATEAVRKMLLKEREQGTGILLISEDLDELMTIADRIAVLYEGQVMGIVPAEEADIETLGLMMAGATYSEVVA